MSICLEDGVPSGIGECLSRGRIVIGGLALVSVWLGDRVPR